MLTASAKKRRFNRATGVSVLQNANNVQIENSSLTINQTTNVTVSIDPLDSLHNKVAINAILNAGGRADDVRCYPGTREELIGIVERWMDSREDNGTTPNMLWLSGPAGAGKSAIVQTVAERCKERGVQAASFFFFRADPTRSSAGSLVATLLHQIIKFHPPARHAVATILSDDPFVFGASIRDQFSQLLFSPLQDFRPPPKPPARRPMVLLIDGLDECDSENKKSQGEILQSLDYLLTQKDSPFLALVASRAEPQITRAFKEQACLVQTIFLDDQYRPENDIRLYVNANFDKIKKFHHLAYTLRQDWPSALDIDAIVTKSSGQFIYAAIVMRFIFNSSASPQLSLERVQGIAPAASKSPFAQLDAIYMYILSQAEDQEAVRGLLSAELLSKATKDHARLSVVALLKAYDPVKYTYLLVQSCSSDLSAILRLEGDDLVIYHASLTDFLKDQSRSGEYYLDVGIFSAKILPRVWTNAQTLEWKIFSLHLLHKQKGPTPELTNALTNLPAMKSHLSTTPHTGIHWRFLFDVSRLYYPAEITTYKKILRQWMSLNVSAGIDYSNLLVYVPHGRKYYWYYKGKKLLGLLSNTDVTFIVRTSRG